MYCLTKEKNALRIVYDQWDIIIPVCDILDVKRKSSGFLSSEITIARKERSIVIVMDLYNADKFMRDILPMLSE